MASHRSPDLVQVSQVYTLYQGMNLSISTAQKLVRPTLCTGKLKRERMEEELHQVLCAYTGVLFKV